MSDWFEKGPNYYNHSTETVFLYILTNYLTKGENGENRQKV